MQHTSVQATQCDAILVCDIVARERFKSAGSYLVRHEGGKVGFLSGVILGERADVAAVLLRALLGQEPEGSVSGGLKLTVRHSV